jgi:Cu+-exporting ATPase
MIEMEVLQNRLSKLTQLWSNDVPEKCGAKHKTITDKISRYFTPILLLIAL